MICWRTRATSILLAVAASLGTLVAVEASTSAPAFAIGCAVGGGCEGKDPQVTGCNTAGVSSPQTYPLIRQSDGVQVGVGELRYSSVCGTNWMRITSWIGTVPMFASIGHGMDYANNYGMRGNYQIGWTLMVYAPTPQVACGFGGFTTPFTGYQEPCA